MFRAISKNLATKADALRQQDVIQKAVSRVCARYSAVTAVFDDRTQVIRLTTTSKTVASEVMLRLPEIESELRRVGAKFRKILVR